MRRKEFLITDRQQLEPVLEQMQWATIALLDEEQPYQVPLNVVWYQSSLFFHSALAGKKMTLIKKNPAVHFNAVLPLSLIPSFFTNPVMACNATQFFLSVSATGQARRVESLERKAEVLGAMMKRLQPVGGYLPIDAHDAAYAAELKKTALVEIVPDNLTGKFKLGQNLGAETRQQLAAELRRRGEPVDLLTARLIEEFSQT